MITSQHAHTAPEPIERLAGLFRAHVGVTHGVHVAMPLPRQMLHYRAPGIPGIGP